MSACSTPFVLASETCASNPVSRPEAIATTPREHSDAEPAPYPFACPKRSFHGGEDLAVDQQGNGQGRRGARGIGKKQECCAKAGTVQGRTCQQQPENRTGARRPQQPRSYAKDQRGAEGRTPGRL